MICPQCRSENCFRSHRHGPIDFIGTGLGLRPWRCRTCDFRFHAWSVAVTFSRFAHCPRCGNFDLERVARSRVEGGPLVSLERFLGFRAYRCDPCRERFFSLLPHRRILPSMVSPAEPKASAS